LPDCTPEACRCSLLDGIAIVQPHNARVAAEDFQIWKLAVQANSH
jgi:hypothetical protein